jgi:uncharacterized protein YeaO (DUF488 family)
MNSPDLTSDFAASASAGGAIMIVREERGWPRKIININYSTWSSDVARSKDVQKIIAGATKFKSFWHAVITAVNRGNTSS